MDAVDRLLLGGGVPPGIEEHDARRGNQVESQASCLHADEEDAHISLGVERADGCLAGGLRHAAVETDEGHGRGLEAQLDQVEHGGPLREHDGLHGGVLGAARCELLHERIDLGG
eukprot:Mycagemm_TRINITY_DN10298_c1_g2::TRINITY_DN10298_c1_g2_i1::g.4214::m.4214 type:complete len:115 gc:universal TRINITY_DN10298_c1_g2_i1:345-689(+)